MHESRGGSCAEKIFAGVRFVLSGFDSVSEAQYRAEIVRRGGVDAGRCDESCTHVIVSGLLYDDPVCVAAREHGKALVTESWVDDCIGCGILRDANRVLYMPVKDLNGIAGCQKLCICLTGYQRQERDDIMKMASLMGAQFSKPLIANQVTHLICYKFEGEKYELAKKVHVKLVNHQWLEDCLKAWEILGVENYTKSGWELEILEAEARDSEEENEDAIKQIFGEKDIRGGSSAPIFEGSNMSIPMPRKFDVQYNTKEEKQSCNAEDLPMKNRLLSTPCKETVSGEAFGMCSPKSKILQGLAHQDSGGIAQACNDHIKGNSLSGCKEFISCTSYVKKDGNTLSLVAKAIKRCLPIDGVDEKFNTLSYSRKNSKKLDSDGETSNTLQTSPPGNLEKKTFKDDSNNSPLASNEARSNCQTAGNQSPMANGITDHMESLSSSLPQKRKAFVSSAGSKSPKLRCQSSKVCSPQSPLEGLRSMQLVTATDVPQGKIDNGHAEIKTSLERAAILKSTENQHAVTSKPNSSSYKKRSLKCRPPHLGANISDTKKHSDANLVGMPLNSESREGSDEQLTTACKSSLEFRAIGATVSSADARLLQDLLLDEQKQVADGTTGIRNTENCLQTSLTDEGSTDETYPRKKKPGSSDRLQESELVNVPENSGDNAQSHAPNATKKESGQPQRTQQDESSSTPDGSDSANRNVLGIIGGTCEENESKAGARKRNVVAKRRLNSRPKLSTGGNEKDRNISCSDTAVTPNNAAVNIGQEEEVNTELGLEKATSSVKNKTVDSVSNQAYPEEKVRMIQSPVSERKNKKRLMNQETSVDAEKENRPNRNDSLTKNFNNFPNHRVVSKRKKGSMRSPKSDAGDNRNKMEPSRCMRARSPEPILFILSGHRLQRKEFQMLIRRLRGRSCRDSHHWSYQATHLIVPDPVRRTEKFFAAAASGRWVIKSDYLTASYEAGKFLEEEPFEWYRNGLTEDGAINLEAPRKWRLLRERTGHGAFYGMKVIIYGDCIAPTLDTLKRVVKAGDGTILATAPPYTRFLKSGVDYAIISPSMPRVDGWVQEFLRNEIPCVLADYLVEYVCKPGFSLDKYVLYDTHAWAEKSFANLLIRSEEVVTETGTASEESEYDLGCVICGSRDRGEVMLVCSGCGVGAHMDCCDPPLEVVPEGDWFCPNCCRSRGSTRPIGAT